MFVYVFICFLLCISALQLHKYTVCILFVWSQLVLWFVNIDFLVRFQIADGQRELIRSYSVKNRHFIGNTSMEACLSFIMANHAGVKKNDLVFDPFVGTGEWADLL